jgi:hypothetical protein
VNWGTKGRLVKKVATFLFLVVNGAWALMAYLLHAARVRPGVIAMVLTVGVLLGNLATYAGVMLAGKMLRKSGAANLN